MTLISNILGPVCPAASENNSPVAVAFTLDQRVEEECIRRHNASTAPRTFNGRGDKIAWGWMTETYRNRLRLDVSTDIASRPSAPAPVEVWFWEVIQATVTRSTRWHPGGLADWTREKWVLAVTGEIGELAEAVELAATLDVREPGAEGRMVGNEAADVFLYLVLFVERLRYDRLDIDLCRGACRHLGRDVDPAEVSLQALEARPANPVDPLVALAGVTRTWGLTCNALKKWGRHLDGISNRSGSGVEMDRQGDVERLVERELGALMLHLLDLCARFSVEFSSAVVATFNATSEKNHFPDRLPLHREIAQ